MVWIMEKERMGFETNSSSSHSLSIYKKRNSEEKEKILKELEKIVYFIVHDNIDRICDIVKYIINMQNIDDCVYGWKREPVKNLWEKFIYLLIHINMMEDLDTLEILNKFLNKYYKKKYNKKIKIKLDLREEKDLYCNIDHNSLGLLNNVIKSEEDLFNFLSEKTIIYIDNDNENFDEMSMNIKMKIYYLLKEMDKNNFNKENNNKTINEIIENSSKKELYQCFIEELKKQLKKEEKENLLNLKLKDFKKEIKNYKYLYA